MSRAMKICKKCGEAKPLSAFYKHPSNLPKTGLGDCIACKLNYVKSYYREHRQDRNSYRQRYRKQNADKDRAWHLVAQRKYAHKNPEKVRASSQVRNAIEIGRIVKQPCAACGDLRTQGHHEDYSKPLEVIWLCQVHHSKLHRERRTT